MRLFNIFGFILIAGMIGCAIADEEESSETVTESNTFSIMGLFRVSHSEIEKYDKEMCERNGGAKAYEGVEESWETWSMCLDGVACLVNIKGDTTDNDTTSSSSEEDISALKYCTTTPIVMLCFDNLMNKMEKCLDTDKKESAHVIRNVTHSLLEFMCENDAAHFTAIQKLFQGPEMPCLMDSRDKYMKCANDTIVPYFKSKVTAAESIAGYGISQWFVPDHEKCTVMDNFQQCIVREMSACTPTGTVDPINMIFNHVKVASTCDYILKSHTEA